MKALLFILLAVFVSFGCKKEDKKEFLIDCTYCYFQNAEYSEGTQNSLNSILSFTCKQGKWIENKGRQPLTPGKPGVCIPCVHQSLKYSEGCISSLNSINTFECVDGKWEKIKL